MRSTNNANTDSQMIYPGYQLNPGDMFQVDPDRVLYATGAPKNRKERRQGRKIKALASKKASDESDEDGAEPVGPVQQHEDPSAAAPPEKPSKDPKTMLKRLFDQAKTLLSDPSNTLPAKRKQDLRAFQRTVRYTMSRKDAFTTSDLDKQLEDITARISPAPSPTPTSATPAKEDIPTLATRDLQDQASTLSPAQLRVLRRALQEGRENPVDVTKSYATPWTPRPWMSAFAFIPRYLEVHQKICSAVYLRHPVARPGLAEVPGPYDEQIYSLAHNWYLRRR